MAGKQPHEHKVFNFELKEVSLEDSVFTGFSAAMGNRDLGNDVIEPGAFKKTIRERVDRRYIKLLDNHNSHSTRDVWGTVVEAEEVAVDGRGENAPTHKLLTTFEVSRADENAQTALRKIAEKHLDQLSIGFRSLREEFAADEDSKEDDPRWAWMMGQGTRTIKEVQWWETSVVIWAMNPEAQILANSVTSLMDFAEKAAASGVHVPEDTVRDTIRALSTLTGGQVMDSNDEVHAAVADLKRTMDDIAGGLDAEPEERLRALLNDYVEMHGDPDVTKFTMWVDETLLSTDEIDDEAEEEEVKADEIAVEDDATMDEEDVTDPIEDEETPVEEVEDDPKPAEEPVGDEVDDEMSLADSVRDLKERIDKLASTLVTDDTADDERVEETPVDDSGSHDEEAEAAKGADASDDESEDEGRTEHFPDGDALALELAALEIDILRSAA